MPVADPKALKALAHHLKPVVQVGANGLTDATSLTVGQVLIIPAPAEDVVEGEAAPAEEAAAPAADEPAPPAPVPTDAPKARR